MRPETRLVRYEGRGLSPPLDRSSTFPYDERGEVAGYFYQRYGHPTGVEAERLLSELEGGRALLFPSGSGAATALVLALLSPGDAIALPQDCYFGVERLFRLEFERWGLRVVDFDQTGPPPRGVQLVWLETPSNPLATFPDLDATVEAAHADGARVVVDSTALTPLLLRPLDHGADFVLHSVTKYLGGHSDVLLGAVACRSEEDAARLDDFRGRAGIVAAPDPAWLLLRSLRTLAVRVERQSATALELARRLQAHPAIERVNYAGLDNPVAARYVTAFGGLLSFEVRGGDEAAHVVETSVRVITNSTSLGGVESLMETRAKWERHRIRPGLVRLSVGLEHVEDLWADLEQALAVATGAARPAPARA